MTLAKDVIVSATSSTNRLTAAASSLGDSHSTKRRMVAAISASCARAKESMESTAVIIQASMPILDINEIRAILPHRYPFLLVDRIVEMEADRVVGIKCITANEPQFTGHFPDFPVMPGVLIVEAMAQTAGILVLHNMPDRANKLVLLVAIENARFRRPVVPGDTLRMEMKILKKKASVAKMAGVATVDGVVVAEAEVMCKLADKEEKAPAEVVS